MIAREQELDNGRVVAVQKIQLGQFCLDRRTLNSDRENRFCKLASVSVDVSVSVDDSVCRSGQQKKNFVISSWEIFVIFKNHASSTSTSPTNAATATIRNSIGMVQDGLTAEWYKQMP